MFALYPPILNQYLLADQIFRAFRTRFDILSDGYFRSSAKLYGSVRVYHINKSSNRL